MGIPTVGDRVAQAAAKIVLEPVFEADFEDCSFGFRPKRSALQALETIRVGFIKGFTHVAEADIQPHPARLGKLLPHRQRRGQVHPV